MLKNLALEPWNPPLLHLPNLPLTRFLLLLLLLLTAPPIAWLLQLRYWTETALYLPCLPLHLHLHPPQFRVILNLTLIRHLHVLLFGKGLPKLSVVMPWRVTNATGDWVIHQLQELERCGPTWRIATYHCTTNWYWHSACLFSLLLSVMHGRSLFLVCCGFIVTETFFWSFSKPPIGCIWFCQYINSSSSCLRRG